MERQLKIEEKVREDKKMQFRPWPKGKQFKYTFHY